MGDRQQIEMQDITENSDREGRTPHRLLPSVNTDLNYMTDDDLDDNLTVAIDDAKSDDTARATASKYNQGDSVEDVKWFDNNQTNLQDFVKDFEEGLRVTDLSGRAKLFIRKRYLNLYKSYHKKHKTTKYYMNASRTTVTVGALMVPALITIDNDVRNDLQSLNSLASNSIYYVTLLTSLFVSVVNAMNELLQLPKRYHVQATTQQRLEQEGWSFLLLRGNYAAYKSHRSCWQNFLYRVECIHQHAATSGLYIQRLGRKTVPKTLNVLDKNQKNNPTLATAFAAPGETLSYGGESANELETQTDQLLQSLLDRNESSGPIVLINQ